MFCALMGGPLSGASMNPARTLGPAVFSGDLSFLWLYTLGPICGASLGCVVYQWIRCGENHKMRMGAAKMCSGFRLTDPSYNARSEA